MVEAMQDSATQINNLYAYQVGENFALHLAQAQGKIAGIRMVADMPDSLIEHLDSLIEEEEQAEDADQSAD